MSEDKYLSTYKQNHIRVVAKKLTKKYKGLIEGHVYWIAKELNIYPDAMCLKEAKSAIKTKTGKINKRNAEFVSDNGLNENGIKAIESYLINEGYKLDSDYKEEDVMPKTKADTSIWERVDLISQMKIEYDKAVAERDEAKAEAQENFELLKQYESEIDELKDRMLIIEKENNDLKTEKKELGKMQLKTVDFDKEIEELQKRIAQYNAEINAVSAEVNEFRKDVSALLTGVNMLQEKKKKLEGVMSDLIGCSKRLINMK